MAGIENGIRAGWQRGAAIWRKVEAYAAHPDPVTEAANWVALVVASNQPFYPLYIGWLVGEPAWPAFITFLSTPFFLAVPALSRRHSLAGRALLPLAGIANTILATKAFGVASGVELFLAPCLVLAAVLFCRSERIVMVALVAVAAFVFAILRDHYGAPLHLYTPEQYAHFVSLNAFSVGSLSVFIGLSLSNALAAIEAKGCAAP